MFILFPVSLVSASTIRGVLTHTLLGNIACVHKAVKVQAYVQVSQGFRPKACTFTWHEVHAQALCSKQQHAQY